jgi:hypothetical protein
MYKVSINPIIQSKTRLVSHAQTPTRDTIKEITDSFQGRVLEKLTVTQPVRIFSVLCAPYKFLTVHRKARHCDQSFDWRINFVTAYPISWLFFHVSLDLFWLKFYKPTHHSLRAVDEVSLNELNEMKYSDKHCWRMSRAFIPVHFRRDRSHLAWIKLIAGAPRALCVICSWVEMASSFFHVAAVPTVGEYCEPNVKLHIL